MKIKFKTLLVGVATIVTMSCINNTKIAIAENNFNPLGIWVSEKFIDNLRQSKNSNKATEGIKLSLLEFQENKEVKAIWSFYEGTQYKYDIKNDTILINSKSKKGLSSMKMYYNTKESKIYDERGSALIKYSSYKIIEEELFKRAFQDEKGKKVIFDIDGSVRGLSKPYTYSFEFQNSLTDLNLNIIYLNLGDNQKKCAYQFDNNKLLIYELNCKDISDDETCEKGIIFKELRIVE